MPIPPGSVMKASDLSSMICLRSRMVVVTTSSSASVSATSRCTSVLGMTPMVRPPAARAAWATAPIADTFPPPDTRVQPRSAMAVPRRVARSKSSG
ncbi:Uncharacterised protein [Mycobacteroides abscessus subsp. abscessus]|nr:Uncharacterised protein [Mycobacteroides abscessus subsp. abscessus]